MTEMTMDIRDHEDAMTLAEILFRNGYTVTVQRTKASSNAKYTARITAIKPAQ